VPAYTIRNLHEVEDSAPKFGFAEALEARFAREALECERVGLAYERLKPNARVPFGHRHGQQEEIYVVVGGGGRVKLDDEIVEVQPWDAIRVSPQTMRQFEAGPEGLELLAFGGPLPDENDFELVPGWWS
jgi:mannose-6-phosphate isomerase-like protein (cupin superfamily)